MKHEDDDDTQVYADTLLIVYQRGFADGKKAAQRKPLTMDEIGPAWAVADGEHNASAPVKRRITRAIEAAHNIKEET
jgi:hypothetical protein